MENKRNNSKMRGMLLAELMSRTDHPTAETLYMALKSSQPKLSLGTVYRNLSVLTEQGLALPVATVDGQTRYDGRTEPHAHFICRRCRKVSDLELPDVITPMYNRIDGCPEGYALNISGLCPVCAGQVQ